MHEDTSHYNRGGEHPDSDSGGSRIQINSPHVQYIWNLRDIDEDTDRYSEEAVYTSSSDSARVGSGDEEDPSELYNWDSQYHGNGQGEDYYFREGENSYRDEPGPSNCDGSSDDGRFFCDHEGNYYYYYDNAGDEPADYPGDSDGSDGNEYCSDAGADDDDEFFDDNYDDDSD